MPLFTSYLNIMANTMVGAAGRVYMHTSAPTEADPTTGRTAVGGGAYENGVTTAASDWSDAALGDLVNTSAFAFGTADEAVGTPTHWSYYLGAVPVAFGTLPQTVPTTVIGLGDTYTMDANSLNITG